MAKTSLRQEKPVTETDIYVKAKRLYREFAERTVAINTRHRARVLTAENSLLDVIGSFSVAYSAIDRETKYEMLVVAYKHARIFEAVFSLLIDVDAIKAENWALFIREMSSLMTQLHNFMNSQSKAAKDSKDTNE